MIRPSREYGHWAGQKSIVWGEEEISGADAVVVVTAHGNVDYDELGAWAKLIVDTRNVMVGRHISGRLVKA